MTTRRTIDNLGPAAYRRYARSIFQTEETFESLKIANLDEAGYVPPQTSMLANNFQTYDWVSQLVGLDQRGGLLAEFKEPNELPRRLPFAFSQLAPGLGTPEKQEADADRINAVSVEGRLATAQQTAIISMYDRLGNLNEDHKYIKSHQAMYAKA